MQDHGVSLLKIKLCAKWQSRHGAGLAVQQKHQITGTQSQINSNGLNSNKKEERFGHLKLGFRIYLEFVI
jgi:hypothetical protein